jgi:hypothetical protein
VLILTAADGVEERVKGLDYGADDYMAKPFALSELEARVRALTRRGMGAASAIIRHGPLEYDQTGRVASIEGKMIELSARELGLLEVLLQRSGRLVSKEQLVELPVRMGRGGEQQRDRGLHPPPAQEDRERARSASPPCADWATAWKRFQADAAPAPIQTAQAAIENEVIR